MSILKTEKELKENEKYRTMLFGGIGHLLTIPDSATPKDVEFVKWAVAKIVGGDKQSEATLPAFTVLATSKEDFLEIIKNIASDIWDYSEEVRNENEKNKGE